MTEEETTQLYNQAKDLGSNKIKFGILDSQNEGVYYCPKCHTIIEGRVLVGFDGFAYNEIGIVGRCQKCGKPRLIKLCKDGKWA